MGEPERTVSDAYLIVCMVVGVDVRVVVVHAGVAFLAEVACGRISIAYWG